MPNADQWPPPCVPASGGSGLVSRWRRSPALPPQAVRRYAGLRRPDATNGYVVAREMGGDADLYADILVWQTVLALLSLPFWLWYLG
ncbi:MAG: hypothetical protein R3D84_11700 [Paracoccaceae bacterium]